MSMTPCERARPYAAAFRSRFLLMLQYRTAALAGFATQCWWGGIKAMIPIGFYGAAAGQAASQTASDIEIQGG